MRSISEWSLYLSPAKSYLDRGWTCFSYSVFSTLVDDPLSPPSSHPTLFTPLPFTTSPLHHSTATHISPFLSPFAFPIISSHHSPSPLLRPLQLTTPQTTPPPVPHTTQNSSLLPHTAPLSVAETRNNVAVMILFLIYSPCLFNLCSTSTQNPPMKA